MRASRVDSTIFPLLLLLGGFVTDLLKHLIEGETLETFLVGDEGIFAWQHVLLPIGALVLVVVFFKNMRHYKATVSSRDRVGAGNDLC